MSEKNSINHERNGRQLTSEKHLTLLVSTTVSRNATTGSMGGEDD